MPYIHADAMMPCRYQRRLLLAVIMLRHMLTSRDAAAIFAAMLCYATRLQPPAAHDMHSRQRSRQMSGG